ncbi:hypothetical protein NDU88_005471 [Pleurodeles waltl]|uniref:Uncharacterized protein n=1 Tax=Pleurodeles waltl TaxID=8319 RepID=A0AAV7SLW1_PLEWA|nr:hypothetical protein NDU88_005471 [Pleurodeles waltl]
MHEPNRATRGGGADLRSYNDKGRGPTWPLVKLTIGANSIRLQSAVTWPLEDYRVRRSPVRQETASKEAGNAMRDQLMATRPMDWGGPWGFVGPPFDTEYKPPFDTGSTKGILNTGQPFQWRMGCVTTAGEQKKELGTLYTRRCPSVADIMHIQEDGDAWHGGDTWVEACRSLAAWWWS